MTLERAIEILEAYHLYRTKGDDFNFWDDLTEAIDTVVKHFKHE